MKKLSMMIFIFSSVITLIAIGIIGLAYGWFNVSKTITSNVVSVGEIVYVKSGSWVDSTDPIFPGADLIQSDLILNNQSTITSQLRFQLTYTHYSSIEDVTGTTTIFDNVDDDISVGIPEEFVFQDGYWYYESDSYAIAANTGDMPLITSLSLNADVVSIEYASKPISIAITIQVKQADNVTWNDLTSYNYDTGYTNP